MSIRTITQILFEDGPQTIEALEKKTANDSIDVADEIAGLIYEKRAHLESDMTIWYAEPIND